MSARSAVKRQVYKALTSLFGDQDNMIVLPILSGAAKGLRIRANLIEKEEAYFWGSYERDILNKVMPFVKLGWNVWDCGTYLGFYTMIFARKVGRAGRVVALEIDLRNLNRTRENAALNQLKNVDFVNAAVGAPVGMVDFVMDDRSNSHLPGTYVGGREMKAVWRHSDQGKQSGRVECISLDQVLLDKGLPKPDLIKMDIDGAEKDALRHGTYVFNRVRPILLLELHNPECDRAAWEFSRCFQYELKDLKRDKILTQAEDVYGTLLCRPL